MGSEMCIRDSWGTLRSESSRAGDWMEMFGTLRVPIKSPHPVLATAPGLAGARRFYLVDVSRLSPEVRARVIDHMAQEFDLPPSEVADGLDGEHGMPILADDVDLSFDARAIL